MELRSDLSKNDLADALILLLEKKAYHKISIQDIVDKAGLSRMAYYRNFENKDDILHFYVGRITDDFIRDTKVDYDALPMDEYIMILFTHLKRWVPFCRQLQKNGLLHFIKHEFDRIFEGKAETDAQRYTYSFVAGGLYNLFAQWLSQDCEQSPEELAEIFRNFMK